MIPSRRDWRGAYNHPAAIRVEAHEAFGWKVHQHRMPAGSTLVLTASAEVERERAPNLTLYTQGRICVTGGDGSIFEDRVSGMYSGERPNHPAGVVTLNAAQDSEFWCFNWHANRGALPALTPLRYPQGGMFIGQEGDRVLVCAGSLGPHEAGGSFRFGGNELVAAPETYGLVIGGDREA
jgi:hypothetical protein